MAIRGECDRTKVRGACAEHDIVLRCGADPVRAGPQPFEADQGQPAVRCGELLDAPPAPSLDLIDVRVNGAPYLRRYFGAHCVSPSFRCISPGGDHASEPVAPGYPGCTPVRSC